MSHNSLRITLGQCRFVSKEYSKLEWTGYKIGRGTNDF